MKEIFLFVRAFLPSVIFVPDVDFLVSLFGTGDVSSLL